MKNTITYSAEVWDFAEGVGGRKYVTYTGTLTIDREDDEPLAILQDLVTVKYLRPPVVGNELTARELNKTLFRSLDASKTDYVEGRYMRLQHEMYLYVYWSVLDEN